ncbi:superkiller complex protein 3-like [Diadema antillarum]|uniref:superkiller complex protein 3-like n=1 Tax=Diadema antillarum TaxID=105358 RepID=UPI003A8A17D2
MAASDSKEMKAALKQAKEAVKGKKYEQALEHLKVVLSHDPSHYNALVLVGKSSTEVGLSTEAEQAFRKATEVDPGQLLAWQGLSQLYEKYSTDVNQRQLLGVYQRLMTLFQDDAKVLQVAEKLSTLHEKLDQPVEACDVLHTVIQRSGEDPNNAKRWAKIVRLLSRLESLNQSSANLLKLSFETLLAASDGDADTRCQHYQQYIQFLLKLENGDVDELKAACTAMHEMFPSKVYPLEKLAELTMIQTYEMAESGDWSVYDKLHELDSKNGLALIGQAQAKLAGHIFESAKGAGQDFKTALEAKQYFKTATELLENEKRHKMFPFYWLFLAQWQLVCHAGEKAEISAKNGIKVLKSYKHLALSSAPKLEETFSILRVRAWLVTGTGDLAVRAVELLNKLKPEARDKTLLCRLLVIAHLTSGDLTSAKKSFDEIPSESRDSCAVLALGAWLMFHEADLKGAKDRLESVLEKEKMADYHYWLGRVYWAMGARNKECLYSFIKATKLDVFHSNAFLYMGHYFKEVDGENKKAKRCYETAFELNPANEGAAIALGDMCDTLDDKEGAVSLYQKVTSLVTGARASWAWLRLGLAQLRAGDATDAAQSFQEVLRKDPNNKHCLECLAEAYLSGGSYESAHKAFSRVLEMDPNSTYSMFKIGCIKQTRGLYSEAITVYQAVQELSPDYVPALTGQGETHLLLARAGLREFFHARAVSHIQQAVSVLTRAILLRPDLSGVWKLLGDACTLVAPLHDNLINISVDGALQGMQEGKKVTVGKGKLLALGGRCYGKAIRHQEDCSSLWHDLAVNYLHQYQWRRERRLANKALQCIKKAISLDATNYIHWTCLGVIAAQPAIDDPGLAQHAFIKSIQLEPKNAMAWTNLGTLYLSHGNLELANKAFGVAQSRDPDYVQSWIGQGMIAETMGREETMDLYRHTTELTTHVEGGLGYADLVCGTILDSALDKRSELYRFNITQMRAVPAATAAVGKVADRVQTSAEAHTLHGILLEREGLHRAAESAFKRALELAVSGGDVKAINTALANHGRVLSSLGRVEEAKEEMRRITPLTDTRDILAMALALYRNQEWPQACLAYEQASELTTDEAERSEILTAQAMVSVQCGDIDTAKTLLFKNSQLSRPCIRGLVTLCALGLRTGDLVLTKAALAELVKQPDQHKWIQESVVLTAASKILQGNGDEALKCFIKGLKNCPSDTPFRALTAEVAILLDPSSTTLASACCRVAQRLGSTQMSILQVDSSTELSSGNHGDPSTCRLSPSLIAAQKAVHAMPGDVNNWALLGAACSAQTTWQALHQKDATLLDVNLQISKFLLQMNKADSKLAPWVSMHTVFSMLQSKQWDEASTLSKRVIDWCDYGEEANANLRLLHCLSGWMKTRKSSGFGPIRDVVAQSQSLWAWQTLGKIYSERGMALAAEACYRNCLQLAGERRQTTLHHQRAHIALMGLRGGTDVDLWTNLGQETLDKLDHQPISHLFKALMFQLLGKHEKVIRKELDRGMKSIETPGRGGYTESILRYHLVEVLQKKDKDAAQALVDDAIKEEDPLCMRLQELIR